MQKASSSSPSSPSATTQMRDVLHAAVDLHVGKLLSEYTLLLQNTLVSTTEGAIEDTALQCLNTRIHVGNLLQSARCLVQLTADLALGNVVNDFARRSAMVEDDAGRVKQRLLEIRQADFEVRSGSIERRGRMVHERGVEMDKTEEEEDALGRSSANFDAVLDETFFTACHTTFGTAPITSSFVAPPNFAQRVKRIAKKQEIKPSSDEYGTT